MVSLKNPFARRRVTKHDTTARLVLPREDLRNRGIGQGDFLGGSYDRQAATLTISLDDVAQSEADIDSSLALQVVAVGNGLGVSVPCALRDEHDLLEREAVLLEPAPDDLGWRTALDEDQEQERRVTA